MEKTFLIKLILLFVFFIGGAFLILLGILIWRRLWDGGSVEVEAECIDLNEHTETIGTGHDRTYFYHAKSPIYRYFYEGKQYISGPKLASNRKGYQPQLGWCTIRINPVHPQKVYSPERKSVALMLLLIGAAWVAAAVLAALLLPV